MFKVFAGLLSLIILTLCFSAEASARHGPRHTRATIKNGLPCVKSIDGDWSALCQSSYCSRNLGRGGRKVAGVYLCMSSKANCPIPGGDGIMFEGEYNFGRSHWYCARGIGIRHDGPARMPQFYEGGGCSGFFQKIDCRGNWFPAVYVPSSV